MHLTISNAQHLHSKKVQKHTHEQSPKKKKNPRLAVQKVEKTTKLSFRHMPHVQFMQVAIKKHFRILSWWFVTKYNISSSVVTNPVSCKST